MKIIAKVSQTDGPNLVSSTISEYVNNVSMRNKLTANEYHARLDIFKAFIEAKYSLHVDEIISRIKMNKIINIEQ